MPKFRNLCLAAASATLLAFAAAGPVLAAGATPASPVSAPSAIDFGREGNLRTVSISPDGKHIIAIASDDGARTVVAVYRTDAMNKPTYFGCGDRSQCVSVRFVKNDRLAVTVRQLRNAGATKDHLFRTLITDLEGKNWRSVFGSIDTNQYQDGDVLDDLPKDPKNILVANREGIFKVDIYTGSNSKIFTSSDKFGSEQIDLKGEVRARQSADYENGNFYIAQWIRNPTSNVWEEHFRWYAKDREPIAIVGFTSDPNIIYVQTNKGQDKSAIFEYDIAQRKFVEPAFEIKLFDAAGVIQSQAPADYGRVLGFTYEGAHREVFWTDAKMASLTKGLRKALGIQTEPMVWTDIATGEKAKIAVADGADVSLNGWSDDMKYAIVVKSGSSQPPEFYLLTDEGKLTLIGKSRPWFNTAALGDTRMIQYPARDGLMIPAFLTTPKKEIFGPGPYPTLVTPHGGPWARDELGWDSSGWVQYFAARGYAILQPQYRGSEGWGQKLWRAGDSEWGQKMQDDKDDGVKYLIDQKIADPKRVAMHGYSYGGYAAMAASVRPNGLYQCAIAGAGVAELDKFRERLNQGDFSRQFQRSTINGLQPLDHAKEVTIPVFLYHGDRDTTVPIEQSERFASALKAAGKPVKFLELKDMGHQYSKWEPGQTAQVLTEIDQYLRTQCKPGGL